MQDGNVDNIVGGGDGSPDDEVRGKVRGGRVLTSQGMMTLWKAIKAGLVRSEKPASKHRTFTRTHMNYAAKKRRRQVAQASRRANRPAKRRTGVKAKRV